MKIDKDKLPRPDDFYYLKHLRDLLNYKSSISFYGAIKNGKLKAQQTRTGRYIVKGEEMLRYLGFSEDEIQKLRQEPTIKIYEKDKGVIDEK